MFNITIKRGKRIESDTRLDEPEEITISLAGHTIHIRPEENGVVILESLSQKIVDEPRLIKKLVRVR